MKMLILGLIACWSLITPTASQLNKCCDHDEVFLSDKMSCGQSQVESSLLIFSQTIRHLPTQLWRLLWLDILDGMLKYSSTLICLTGLNLIKTRISSFSKKKFPRLISSWNPMEVYLSLIWKFSWYVWSNLRHFSRFIKFFLSSLCLSYPDGVLSLNDKLVSWNPAKNNFLPLPWYEIPDIFLKVTNNE